MTHYIFEAHSYDESIPEGFNAVKVCLDGTLQSALDWKEEQEAARRYIEQGHQIFWEIDLGIPYQLRLALTHSSQFLSLKLSLEHFRETIWPEFQESTVGVCIYRGSVDFCDGYRWDEEQEGELRNWLNTHFESFEEMDSAALYKTPLGLQVLQLYCRNAVSHYFDLLANYLPFEAESYILVDAQAILDPVHLANLLSKEHFPELHIGLKNDNGYRFSGGYIGRQLPEKVEEPSSILGLCLPPFELFKPSQYQLFREVLTTLPCRVIPESRLITEWEGLDYLIVSPEHVSAKGVRMLKGFCAAGGTVVSLGQKIGLDLEIPYEAMLLKIRI